MANPKDYAPRWFLETVVELDGRSQSVADWCKEKGLSRKMVYERRTVRHQSWPDAFKPKQKLWSRPINKNYRRWGAGMYAG